MSKKQNIGKKIKTEITLDREESDELQMITDRLAVQNPEGESFERYLHSLGSSLAGRPRLALALIDKLSRNPSQTGFRTFEALEKTLESAPHKRHLRQAAYRFSQRGFASVEKEALPDKVVLIQEETRKPEAHFFLVKGTLWLISALIPEKGTGYSLISAFMEEDYQSMSVKIVSESSSKVYRDYLRRISGHTKVRKPLAVPMWHAARLFFEMLELRRAEGSDPDLERGRELFELYREPERKPYVYELMPEIEEPERHLPEIEIEPLLAGMDLAWLRFTREELAPLYEKIKALDSPVLVVSREIQTERSLDSVRSAADELCAGKTRFLFKRFFEEQAMAFKLISAEKEAMWAWILARHLAGQSPAGQNPAVFQLVLYSVQHYWPDDFKKQEAAAAPAQERRTESGIILP